MSPPSLRPTADGVSRWPSALGTSVIDPLRQKPTRLLVVPRSIPTIIVRGLAATREAGVIVENGRVSKKLRDHASHVARFLLELWAAGAIARIERSVIRERRRLKMESLNPGFRCAPSGLRARAHLDREYRRPLRLRPDTTPRIRAIDPCLKALQSARASGS